MEATEGLCGPLHVFALYQQQGLVFRVASRRVAVQLSGGGSVAVMIVE